jgi:hypothetical protein
MEAKIVHDHVSEKLFIVQNQIFKMQHRSNCSLQTCIWNIDLCCTLRGQIVPFLSLIPPFYPLTVYDVENIRQFHIPRKSLYCHNSQIHITELTVCDVLLQ